MLMPEQLWALTPRELFMKFKGWLEQRDYNLQLAAFVSANIMNIHLKKKVSVKDLTKPRKEIMKLSPDEYAKKLKEIEDIERRFA